jgi:hypothetical protein
MPGLRLVRMDGHPMPLVWHILPRFLIPLLVRKQDVEGGF